MSDGPPNERSSNSRRVIGRASEATGSAPVSRHLGPSRKGGRHAAKKSKGTKALRIGGIFVAVIVAVVVGVAGYGWYRYNQIGRSDLALDTASQSGVQNILIVGSDSREAVSKTDADASAFMAKGVQTGGQRSDTIMVARVDAKKKTIDLMSFPRDLWIPIAPNWEYERINTAFGSGKTAEEGAQRLIDTIRKNFGIEINHYVQIDFKSFKGITEAVGGVSLYFEKGVRDENSGFYQPAAGCFTLKGDQALAYVRSRHLEYFDGKTKKWISDPSGDLGRITRQTYFMKTMVDRAQEKFGSFDLKKINDLVSSVSDNITLDSKFDISEMISLAKSFKGFKGDQMGSYALPVYQDMTSGGASIVRLDAAGAEPIFNIFRGMPLETVTPYSVYVTVNDASGSSARVGQVSAELSALGYRTTAGSTISKKESVSVIRYRPGFELQADLLARQLGGSAKVMSDTSVPRRTPLTLTIGTSFTSVLPTAVAPSTTTTLVPSTTASSGNSSNGTAAAVTTETMPATEFVGLLAGKPPQDAVCAG
ncbi:MAG: hypothetical protein RLZZ31_192 [Actinomycetota bacterium]